MSGLLTLNGAQVMLTSVFGGGGTPPESFYMALIRTVEPSPYITGEELDEPDDVGYARVPILNTAETWVVDDATPNVVTMVVPATFQAATEDWGTVSYWALTDAATGGECYLVGKLERPLIVNDGDTVSIEAYELDVEIGPFFGSSEES
jgi:hypothetical protein